MRLLVVAWGFLAPGPVPPIERRGRHAGRELDVCSHPWAWAEGRGICSLGPGGAEEEGERQFIFSSARRGRERSPCLGLLSLPHPSSHPIPSLPPSQILVAQKVATGVYKGVTTTELDELAAETAAAMTATHPDYAVVR